MNPDFVALLRELSAAEARFMVVGGYAVSFHSRTACHRRHRRVGRTVRPDAARVFRALHAFGAPLRDPTPGGPHAAGRRAMIGAAPRQIDAPTSLTGLEFEEAWADRTSGLLGGLEVPFIGRESLIRNKRALGRARDLADLESLEPGS